jgi:hypothetical protein
MVLQVGSAVLLCTAGAGFMVFLELSDHPDPPVALPLKFHVITFVVTHNRDPVRDAVTAGSYMK